MLKTDSSFGPLGQILISILGIFFHVEYIAEKENQLSVALCLWLYFIQAGYYIVVVSTIICVSHKDKCHSLTHLAQRKIQAIYTSEKENR